MFQDGFLPHPILKQWSNQMENRVASQKKSPNHAHPMVKADHKECVRRNGG
jgi:hypothetical protein